MPDQARRWLSGAALFCVLFSARADAVSLAVCLAANNPPYSTREPQAGFDHDVAMAVASDLGRDFVPLWIDNETTIVEIEESDIPHARLARGECDAIFSMPGPASVTLADSPKLALGEAYYGAAFELFARAGTFPARPAEWRGRGIAIQTQTVAHFAADAAGAESRNYFSIEAALTGLTQGEAEAALLWGPRAGWLLRQPGAPSVVPVPGYQPPAALSWNLHVATRAADSDLRDEIDGALAALMKSGRLREIAASYGIPIHAVFKESYSPSAVKALGAPAQ